MAFLTYSEIKTFAAEFSKAQILEKASTFDDSKFVFLSYCSSDEDYLVGVIKFFEKFRTNVYVDKYDKRLPDPPNTQTADLLKKEIRSCGRFVLLVSPNSKDSIWVPWELGLADGFKGVGPVALLPIGPTSIEEEWVNRQYLGLYPRIIFGLLKGNPSAVWYVFDPRDRKSWTLEQWLRDSFLS